MKALSFNTFIKINEQETPEITGEVLLRKYLDKVLYGKGDDVIITKANLDAPHDGFHGMMERLESDGDRSGSGSEEEDFDATVYIAIGLGSTETTLKELGIEESATLQLTLIGTSYVSGSWWYDSGNYGNPPDGGSDIDEAYVEINEVYYDGDDFPIDESTKEDLKLLAAILSARANDGKDFEKMLKNSVEDREKYIKSLKKKDSYVNAVKTGDLETIKSLQNKENTSENKRLEYTPHRHWWQKEDPENKVLRLGVHKKQTNIEKIFKFIYDSGEKGRSWKEIHRFIVEDLRGLQQNLAKPKDHKDRSADSSNRGYYSSFFTNYLPKFASKNDQKRWVIDHPEMIEYFKERTERSTIKDDDERIAAKSLGIEDTLTGYRTDLSEE